MPLRKSKEDLELWGQRLTPEQKAMVNEEIRKCGCHCHAPDTAMLSEFWGCCIFSFIPPFKLD